MKSYAVAYVILIVAVLVVVFVWRSTAGRRVAEPDIDFVMDRHAEDAVIEAQEKYTVVLDYSPASVEKVDAILAGLHAEYVKHPVDEKTVGRQSRLWGAYLGAVIKKVRPAKWEIDSDVAGKGALPLVFGPKSQTFPCAWTYKRIVNGDEDNIIVKYQLLITDRDKPREGLSFPRSSQ